MVLRLFYNHNTNKLTNISNTPEKENRMPYRPVFVMSSGERATNAQVFETQEQAESSAIDTYRVWTMPVDYSTEMCEGPVNYHRVDGRDVRMIITEEN